jgi:hypothetical protein
MLCLFRVYVTSVKGLILQCTVVRANATCCNMLPAEFKCAFHTVYIVNSISSASLEIECIFFFFWWVGTKCLHNNVVSYRFQRVGGLLFFLTYELPFLLSVDSVFWVHTYALHAHMLWTLRVGGKCENSTWVSFDVNWHKCEGKFYYFVTSEPPVRVLTACRDIRW